MWTQWQVQKSLIPPNRCEMRQAVATEVEERAEQIIDHCR